MPSVQGTSVLGRQTLMPYTPVADNRMALVISAQNPSEVRLFGRVSIEVDGGGTLYYQIFDKAIWVPGTYWSVDARLLTGQWRAAVWWKIAGLSYQFVWV